MIKLVKNIVKRVLPEDLLKGLYTRFLDLKLGTVDKILFPEYPIPQQAFHIQRDAYPFRLNPVQKDYLDPRLKKQYDENDYWTQDEYLLVLDRPVLIEPDQGWGLVDFNKLVYPSLGFSRAPYVPKPAFRKLLGQKEIRHFEEIISLRDTGERNYFHFYNDILPKLFFLQEKVQVSPQVPVLIARSLFESGYFQYFYQRSFLKDLSWVIQDDFYVQARKTYFCKPLTHTKKYLDAILDLTPDFTQPQAHNRIFITRSKATSRFLENKTEIEDLCCSYGFQVVDFEGMTLEEQMEVFARARYAIGVHGAGLTNMIYRRGQPMSLLEIFPPGDYFPFHYILLANQYHYHYDGFIGEKGGTRFSPGFHIDTGRFKAAIEKLLLT